MVRAKQNPRSEEAAMSLPSMTTAFCLSGIAGLALTSAAMPPIGDGLSHRQAGCEQFVGNASCLGVAQGITKKPGAVSSRAGRTLAHCKKAAANARPRPSIQLAENCTEAGPASSANRFD
jgi:hypothetical protein